MRRAVLTAIVLLVGVLIAVTVFCLYSNYEEEVPFDDVIYRELTVEGNRFCGLFECTDESKLLCGYDHKVEGNTLFITLNSAAGAKEALAEDENGYVTVEFEFEGEIERVVYLADGKETVMVFEKR